MRDKVEFEHEGQKVKIEMKDLEVSGAHCFEKPYDSNISFSSEFILCIDRMYSMKLIFVDDKKVSVTTILDATIPKQFRREFVTAWNAQDDRATVITEASRVSSALAPAWAARSQDNSSVL